MIAFLGQLKDQFKTTDGGSPVVPTEAKLERYKAELSNFFDQERRRHEWDVELFKSVIQSGQIALRSCILVNGGAAVALLAFLGHVSSQAARTTLINDIAGSMGIYAAGVAAGALATGLAYLAQWLYMHSSKQWIGGIANVSTILTGLTSLGAFSFASWRAYQAFFAG